LNSGMLNVNGGYSPAEASARTGVHAESHDFSRGELKPITTTGYRI